MWWDEVFTSCGGEIDSDGMGGGDVVKLGRRVIFNGEVRVGSPLLGCWRPLDRLKAADGAV